MWVDQKITEHRQRDYGPLTDLTYLPYRTAIRIRCRRCHRERGISRDGMIAKLRKKRLSTKIHRFHLHLRCSGCCDPGFPFPPPEVWFIVTTVGKGFTYFSMAMYDME